MTESDQPGQIAGPEMSVEDIEAAVNRRAEEEARQYPAKPASGVAQSDQGEPDLDFIWQCYRAGEVGAGTLFAQLNRGRFAYNVNRGAWMRYVGPYWEIDDTDRSLAAIESTVVTQFLRLADDCDTEMRSDPENAAKVKQLKERKGYVLKWIKHLRKVATRRNVLAAAHTIEDPLIVREDQLDQHPWLLACPNAVVDLRTGEKVTPDPFLWLTKTTRAKWAGLAAQRQARRFKEYLLAALDGNQEAYDFLIRVLGYGITGLNIERIFLVLYGPHGQNGKGTLMEILYHILHQHIGPIQSEMLMAQKQSRNSNAPSPEIVALKGRRIVWASETEEDNRFATGRIKWISGGDPLTGRGLNDKYNTEFMPTHIAMLLTNSQPGAAAHDQAFWERCRVLEFPLSFVAQPDPKLSHHRPRMPGLADALMHEEAAGILALLVQGCLDYQRLGLAPPPCVMKYTKDYQEREDTIGHFVEECCLMDPKQKDWRISSANLYNRFREWWVGQSSYKPMSQKRFSELLALKCEKIKSNGTMHFIGLNLKPSGDYAG